MNDTKKITLATVKSFMKKNAAALYVHNLSAFDGMEDGVRQIKGSTFRKVEAPDFNQTNTYGIGVWLVGSSRDYFNAYDRIEQKTGIRFVGYEVSNCCGNFILAINADGVANV